MQPNNDVLVVDQRHNGPPGSGNGGWTSGLIAAYITEGVPEITLHRPPPLDTPLSVIRLESGLRVVDPDETIIATGRSRDDDIAPVPGVTFAQAGAASHAYPGHGSHHFPTCYVCGPERPDGLRIFPGPMADGRVAAAFVAPESIDAVTVWAALDCPGGWTVITGEHPWVLGRLAVAIHKIPEAHGNCVVVGQMISRAGRKALVRTTLYGPGGDIAARAEATWIAIPPV